MVGRIGFATVLAVGVVAASPPARAADATGDEDCEEAQENTRQVGHDVVVRMPEPGVATFDVTITFEATAPGPICLTRNLEFPGVVTSFSFRTDARWRKGTLRRDNPAAPAEGHPIRLPRKGAPWALLEPQGGGAFLATSSFRTTAPVQIRYTFWAQGEATRSGHRWVYCPRDDHNEVEPFKLAAAASEKTPIDVRPDDDNDPSCSAIETHEPPRATLTARYGVYQPLPRRWFWWLELNAPTTLGPALPEPGPVVFVLDASRSQESNGGLATQLAIAQAYLANAPRAEAELLLVGREVERVFERFVPAADFGGARLAGLARRPLGNGSFLDRGAARAAELLAADGRPGRVVLFTDGHVRSAFDQKGVTAALRRAPAGTVVHVVYPGNQENEKIDHRWGGLDEIAKEFGGAAYHVSVGKQPAVRSPTFAAALRRLIAPDRIESVNLFDRAGPKASEWPEFVADGVVAHHDGEVMPGEAITWRGLTAKPPPRGWRITGWVWGKKFEVRPALDSPLQRRLSRLLATEDEVTRCEEHLLPPITAGLRGGFLAPGLVFWVPGAGVPEMLGRAVLCCDGCMRGGTTILRGAVVGSTKSGGVASPKRDDLPAGLLAAAGRCGARRAKVETQGDEILDVAVEGGTADQRRCAAEAIWAFRLPDKFNPIYWRLETYDVALPPAP